MEDFKIGPTSFSFYSRKIDVKKHRLRNVDFFVKTIECKNRTQYLRFAEFLASWRGLWGGGWVARQGKTLLSNFEPTGKTPKSF